MANMNDLPFKSLQFYATAPYACSYIDDLEARSQVVTPPQLITTKIYSSLIQSGFRRSGHFTYRPYCDNCQACIASRVRVQEFTPNRSQRRAQKKHQDLIAKVLPLQYREEHFQLYKAYIQSRHAHPIEGNPQEPIENDEEQYREFLVQSHIESFIVEFRANGVLKMVSVIDQVLDGISSVYTFYEASDIHASYGTYGILWQIEYAKREQLPFVYLGYYIEKSQKMSYKILFKPLEGIVDNQWITISEDMTFKKS